MDGARTFRTRVNCDSRGSRGTRNARGRAMASPGKLTSMIIDPSPEMLEERRRLGHDTQDEVWDGVLHMVPPASFRHQQFGLELAVVLRAIAKARGYLIAYEVGVLDPSRADFSNYRQPDITVVDPAHASERGVEGRAELIVEILSPNDES